MDLEFRRFQVEDFPTYMGWFVDPELDHRLGPMDQEWLDAVLSEPEAEGATWGVWRAGELVAVIETVFHPDDPRMATISAVATRPDLRRQGIGAAVLQQLVASHQCDGIIRHVAYAAGGNIAAHRLLESAGFSPVSGEPDEHGYIEYRLAYQR